MDVATMEEAQSQADSMLQREQQQQQTTDALGPTTRPKGLTFITATTTTDQDR